MRDLPLSQGPFPAPSKFTPDGHAIPFYGLTCIAWVDQNSKPFQRLCALQEEISGALENSGFGDVFACLTPASFHMTVCDVVASTHPIPARYADLLIQRVQAAFTQIGKPGSVTAQLQGLGLDTTITAQVRFARESELSKVYAMERQIKHAIREALPPELTDLAALLSFRPFAGHISLAYCVKDLAERQKERIREILQRYDTVDLGTFTFSRFDLTCFIDMNSYIPLLTLNLDDGTVTEHARCDVCLFSDEAVRSAGDDGDVAAH